MPQGKLTPGQGIRTDLKPWRPNAIIDSINGRTVSLSISAAQRMPNRQPDVVIDTAIIANDAIQAMLDKK